MISVVIPTFNRDLVINRSINSIVSQTFKNWEIIVIDDGGTDDTEAIIKKYQHKYNNIFYYKFPNMGANIARNIGAGLSKGELIAFLDSDDTWTSRRLELVSKEYQNDNEKFFITDFKGNGDRIGKIKRKFLDSNNFKQILLSHNLVGGTSNYVVPRKLFFEIQGFDQDLTSCQDHDFINRLTNTYELKFLPGEYAIFYRDTGNRISLKSQNKLSGHIAYYKKYKAKMNILSKILSMKKIALISYYLKSPVFFRYFPAWVVVWILKKIYRVSDERELYFKLNPKIN